MNVIPLALSLAALLALAATEAGDDDAEKYAGVWTLRSAEFEGEEQKDGWLGSAKVQGREFAGETGSLAGGWSEKGTFSVVEARTGFDRVTLTGRVKVFPNNGRRDGEPRDLVSRELWRMPDPSTLQRCSWLDDGARPRDYPAEFATKKGDRRIIWTYTKAKG